MTVAYLDRLAHSVRFDSWRTEELVDALASLDAQISERWQSQEGGPRVLNIRLQVYRQRLERELDRRAAGRDQ